MRSLQLLTLMFLSSAFVIFPVVHCPTAIGQIRSNDEGDEDEEEDPEDVDNGQVAPGRGAGVSIDALNVLRTRASSSVTGDLDGLRSSSAAKPSAKIRPQAPRRKPAKKLRFVSLPRLEQVATKRFEAGLPLTEELQYLAGLVRADYLFIYPESGEVVIAGPAANWRRTKKGRVLTVNSRQPVLRLEDLVVALRAFPYSGSGTSEIGCSIDPTQRGLARMQAYVKSISPRPPSAQVITAGLKKSLGEQTVTITGIPANTHFAHVMLEADYRMKLIGIGLASPTVPIKSYLSLARPKSSRGGLSRWYFTPQYECVRVSPDRHVVQLGSSGARLIGAAELVAANGHRSQSARSDRASKGFTTDFTRKYAALAKAEPIYAELRNIMDLSIISAAIQFFDAYAECDWQPDLFCDQTKFDIETHDVPTRLPTAANAVWKGRRLLTPVGGGVVIRSTDVIDTIRLADETLLDSRPTIPSDLADGQWWWDSE